MKDNVNKLVSNYFENEVLQKQTPQFPINLKKKKTKIKWDMVFMAACIAGSLILILLPSTYNNSIRKSYVPMSKYEAFKEEVPRVIFDASLYFKNKKGVKND